MTRRTSSRPSGYRLDTGRVLHGRRDCSSLSQVEDRDRIREAPVPDSILNAPHVRPSTCYRCGWGLYHSIVKQQKERADG